MPNELRVSEEGNLPPAPKAITFAQHLEVQNLGNKPVPVPRLYTEYDRLTWFSLEFCIDISFDGKFKQLNTERILSLPEININSIPNPLPKGGVRVFTQEVMSSHIGIRGFNEEDQQSFIMFLSERDRKEELTTLVFCSKNCMSSDHSTEAGWMSYRRGVDEKSEFCLASAMKPVSHEDIQDLTRACLKVMRLQFGDYLKKR